MGVPCFHSVEDVECLTVTVESTHVANLTTAFRIKGRLIENHDGLITFIDFLDSGLASNQ